MYADTMTDSMRAALGEMSRRRERQEAYNREHGITPESVVNEIDGALSSPYERDYVTIPLAEEASPSFQTRQEFRDHITGLEREMRKAAENLEFERAAVIRDQVKHLRERDLGFTDDG